ncbi:hypothetical protein [Nonomuraea gerenzanensis]|uniref:Uncharacterized protein n=1 Tax=Nonomuraea gerenzanensis TaxID=93944 RepID=A0A1M4BL92_9ACTN|nr:hypothetical protein [Nonomuraea gerenzanensis]UBU09997.1 hypothetical protein LCN96_37350 [Nonomuraea gerenzanensis]SAP16294.1 hypothetical protein BN4615_P10957 [Nonomuraea gerenzanensis]
MTIQDATAIQPPAHGGDPEVIADFESRIESLTEQAEQLAGERSKALQEIASLEVFAEGCMQRGLKLRAVIARYREHLEAELATPAGDPADEHGNVQTALIPRPRTRYPLVHLPGVTTPHLGCVGCGTPLREATAAEVEAITGGQALHPRCPKCTAPTRIGATPYPSEPRTA